MLSLFSRQRFSFFFNVFIFIIWLPKSMFAIMRKITFSSVWFSSPCTMRCKGAVLEGGINIATCALLYIFYDFVCVFMPHMLHVCGGLRATFKSGTGFPPSPLLSHGLSCFCYTVYFKLAGPQALERLSCLLTSSEQECWGCRNEESHLAIHSHASFWVAALVIRVGGKCLSPLSVFPALLAFLHGELVLELGT